ncbi:MAG: MerR family transcriptional regulator [Proteobacteria bacterium]|nr:MerR family transcriptional regulator [Pseudomonadota bacterium]
MTDWTLPELVAEAAKRIEALPAPKNGQVRAVPDERTVRYYGTIGLLDRPSGARGRTSLYGARHLAQIVAIKRMQAMGRSLAEIQGLWPTLDAAALQRMSGVPIEGPARKARAGFWKAPVHAPAAPHAVAPALDPTPLDVRTSGTVELRITLAPNVTIVVAVPSSGLALTEADLQAIHAAAAPLVAELASRQLVPHNQED